MGPRRVLRGGGGLPWSARFPRATSPAPPASPVPRGYQSVTVAGVPSAPGRCHLSILCSRGTHPIAKLPDVYRKSLPQPDFRYQGVLASLGVLVRTSPRMNPSKSEAALLQTLSLRDFNRSPSLAWFNTTVVSTVVRGCEWFAVLGF